VWRARRVLFGTVLTQRMKGHLQRLKKENLFLSLNPVDSVRVATFETRHRLKEGNGASTNNRCYLSVLVRRTFFGTQCLAIFTPSHSFRWWRISPAKISCAPYNDVNPSRYIYTNGQLYRPCCQSRGQDPKLSQHISGNSLKSCLPVTYQKTQTLKHTKL
jgi:hypothetical protein